MLGYLIVGNILAIFISTIDCIELISFTIVDDTTFLERCFYLRDRRHTKEKYGIKKQKSDTGHYTRPESDLWITHYMLKSVPMRGTGDEVSANTIIALWIHILLKIK